jgi:hypothetical protein
MLTFLVGAFVGFWVGFLAFALFSISIPNKRYSNEAKNGKYTVEDM